MSRSFRQTRHSSSVLSLSLPLTQKSQFFSVGHMRALTEDIVFYLKRVFKVSNKMYIPPNLSIFLGPDKTAKPSF